MSGSLPEFPGLFSNTSAADRKAVMALGLEHLPKAEVAKIGYEARRYSDSGLDSMVPEVIYTSALPLLKELGIVDISGPTSHFPKKKES